jgi:hypothetical protein
VLGARGADDYRVGRPIPAFGGMGVPRGEHMESPHIHTCKHCGIRYDWRRSPSSSLKMTYCGSLCEQADLGFTIESMLHPVEMLPASWKQLMAA